METDAETVGSGDSDVLNTLIVGASDTTGMIRTIETALRECADGLRVEQSSKVFDNLAERIGNLFDLVAFVGEVKNGLSHLQLLDDTGQYIACWEDSTDTFTEMLDAFERKDWVSIADFIEYEISPLLNEGASGLESLVKYLSSRSD